VIGVAAVAAPLPLLWFEQQSALQRIAMHVAQLLDPLALAPQIEIVEAGLRDVWLFRAKLELALGSAVAARVGENQRQNLVGFGFGNAHPPAKNPRKGWDNRRRKGDLRR
jgi:tRNA U34 5-methylaminomethyl-2-thiouridine-forming methyltransferase MnmC